MCEVTSQLAIEGAAKAFFQKQMVEVILFSVTQTPLQQIESSTAHYLVIKTPGLMYLPIK